MLPQLLLSGHLLFFSASDHLVLLLERLPDCLEAVPQIPLLILSPCG